MSRGTLRTCEKGHKYYKSTDCPTCPTCEKEKKPSEGFLSRLSSPARSALLHYLGIDTLEKLSAYTEKEILKLHGMGKASMPILRKALEEKGLKFKDEDKSKKQKNKA
jgi:DNA-directed RNA polymerase alpha subunit